MRPPRTVGETRALVAIGLLACFDALWGLGRPDWKTDESLDGGLAWSAVHDGRWALEDGHPVFVRWFLGAGQLAFGQDRFGIRIAPALASIGAVALLYVVGTRLHGRMAGLVAAGLWAALPRALVLGHVVVGPIRGDRFGYLEPFMVVALLGATATGWRWIERGRPADVLATGVLVGLATAFKPTAIVVVVPIAAVGLWRGRSWRTVAVDAAAMGALAATVFVLTYLPVGRDAPAQIRELFRYQFDHARTGHELVVDGRLEDHQSGLVHLVYQWRGMGWPACLGLLIGAAGAWTGRRCKPVVYVTAIWGTLLALHLVSSVALPHYYLLWAPFSVLLAAMGVAELAHAAGEPRSPRQQLVARVALGAAAVLFAGSALVTAWQVATVDRGDYGRMAEQLRVEGVEPRAVRYQGEAVDRYFPTAVSGQIGFTDPDAPFDLLVLDPRDTPMLAGGVGDVRAKAAAAGLVRHRIGRLEVWYRA